MAEGHTRQLEDLLWRCCVRIGTLEEGGTGFFVAPGLILTCAHVVENEHNRDASVQFTPWEGQPGIATIDSYLPKPYPDLALLRTTMTDHPCVYLDGSIPTTGEDLLSNGFPDIMRSGDPVHFEFEDMSPRPDQLKLRQGQARRGLSGSPLLRSRTGAVCGIVNKSRDTTNDLGARAIPAATILAQLPQIISKQRLFHIKDRSWLNRMPAPPRWPRVFLGYNPEEPAVRDIATNIRNELEAAGHIVFPLAKPALETSSWLNDLDIVIGRCHGAVLLISGGAGQSDLVRRASRLLAGRHRVDDGFVLVPVLLDPTAQEQLRSNDIGQIDLNRFPVIVADNVAQVVQVVIARLAGLQQKHVPGETRIEVLGRRVREILRVGDVADDVLREIAKGIGRDFEDEPDCLTQIGWSLWNANTDMTKQAIRQLRAVLGPKPLAELLRIVMYANWVSPQTACLVPLVVFHDSSRKAVGINGTDPLYVGEGLVRRAFSVSEHEGMWPIAQVPNHRQGGDIEELLSEIRQAIQKTIFGDAGEEIWKQSVVDENLAEWHDPVFIAVTDPIPRGDDVKHILETFPSVTFIFLTGGSLPRDPAQYPDVLFLDPPLEMGNDRKARVIYETLYRILTKP